MKKTKAKKPAFDAKKFFTWLRSGLRSMSRRYPPIYEALAAAKEPYIGDNPRQKYAYRCAVCNGLFSAKEVSVDHRIDCGSLTCWEDVQGFMERLFCGKEGLDVLCHADHDVKTYAAKHDITLEQAALEKRVIDYCKTHSKQEIVDFCQSFGYNSTSLSNEAKRRGLVKEIFLKEKM